MRMMVASDIHGAVGYCRELLRAYDRERPDRLLTEEGAEWKTLGGDLYHTLRF